ncbi:MAG: FecCD family ABC transporter permease [Phycisphaerales bacterium]
MSGVRVASEGRRSALVAVLVVMALATAGLRLSIGRIWTGDGWQLEFGLPGEAVVGFRLGAIAVASTVGASLAISGLFLQGLLRNPLASPFVLGLSSGATLGLAVAMWLALSFGFAPFAGLGTVVPAFAGAMGTLAIVALAGRRRGGLDPITLVLAGVVVSSVCGALLMLVHHLLPPGTRGDLVAWTMGRIDEQPDLRLLGGAAVIVAGAIAASWTLARSLDVAMLGEDEARSVGLGLSSWRWGLLLGAGLLAASAVAIAGPIAFVGLVAPHAARILVGPAHRWLVPASALCGVILLVGADVARQPIDLGAGRLPIGVLTAILGGPAFLWLLHRGRLEGWS